MIKLIADSGSTKTDWLLVSERSALHRFQTPGMNPSLMNDEQLTKLLVGEVFPVLLATLNVAETQLKNDEKAQKCLKPLVDEIAFYGAGCRPEQEERMSALLCQTLCAARATVASDLLGAAHALCGREEGIVCILGTGSGSGLYDGQRFVQQTPSLGFILGDEGSGASLGKHLLADVLKGVLPSTICAAFIDKYQIDVAAIIQKVYREPAPNQYMAQFSHFLSEYREAEAIQQFLLDEFGLFFSRNIRPYARPELPIHFVGSIAAVFQKELTRAAETEGFRIGIVERSPIDVLLRQG